MKLDLTFDNKFMVVSSDFPFELITLRRELTRELSDAWIRRKVQPTANTQRCFVNEYGMIPIGLWLEVMKVAKKFNIYLELSPAAQTYFSSFQFNFDQFNNYITRTFNGAECPDKDIPGKMNPFKPREYQIKSAYTLLKYRNSCGEISTSGGKTLISFIIFKYLIDCCYTKKILYIVPSVDLATQSAEKYEQYEGYLKIHGHDWKIGILKSGLKKKEKEAVENCNILFGTFQSLCRRPLEFFQDFTAAIIDESHHLGSSPSMKNIMDNCVNSQFAIGVTGTMPKHDTYENLVIQSYIGPIVYTLTANELINEQKSATPIYAIFQIMDWCPLEEKKALYIMRHQKSTNKDDFKLGGKLMKQETQFINNSYPRLKYIGDMAIRMLKNVLILFGDIKGGYGKKLQEYIKDNSNKDVYYVDGSTPTDIRDYYKSQCENDDTGNTVLVASIGTFGEGIDLCNIWSIFLVNSAKSERLVRQICGRGLRQYPGKDKTLLFDFVDDLRFTMDGRYEDNYMWKHYKERKKIYKEQNFPTYEQTISFS